MIKCYCDFCGKETTKFVKLKAYDLDDKKDGKLKLDVCDACFQKLGDYAESLKIK